MYKNDIIETAFEESFKCECGNKLKLDGFCACNKHGEIVEPSFDWEGHYKCERCDQIYFDTTA